MSRALKSPVISSYRVFVESLRVTFIVILAVLISGLLPMIIQTYGWFDMARKAGGVDKIVEVMTEAPPCEFCKAAQALQKKSDSDHQAPMSGDRVEVVKTYAVFHHQSLFKTESLRLNLPPHCFVIKDETLPDNLLTAPETPPPQRQIS